MIRRALAAAALAVALLPAAAASAAVTRPVQAFDTPTFRTIWTPRNVPAQVGDTVEWRFTQPGNPNAVARTTSGSSRPAASRSSSGPATSAPRRPPRSPRPARTSSTARSTAV